MKFSVLINNYNYARFLPDTLASVAAQTLPAHEIIVVDDGSTDESLAVLAELGGKHAKLQVHAQANAGQLAALRAGVARASGDWCVFLDADDLHEPGHLAALAEVLAREPDLGAIYAAHRETEGPPVYRRAWPEGRLGPSIALVAITRLRVGSITSAISLRTDYARAALELPTELESDWRLRADDCLVYGSALHGAVAYHLGTPTVRYRIHGGNGYAHRDRAHADYRDKFRLARLCAHYVERVGVFEADLPGHLARELCFRGNAHPYVRRRYRRAIRALQSASLWAKLGLYRKSYLRGEA
jgi:glycosyltransferase involved in cell wall biosynthesis